MNEVTQTVEVAQVEVAVTPVVPKSVAQRAARKRFSFGPVWNHAVIEGKAADFAKLLEQAVTLKVGQRADLKKLKVATLRTKVAARLQAQTTPVVEQPAEVAPVQAS